MKTMIVDLGFQAWELKVVVGRYRNRNFRVRLVGANGEPFCILSADIPAPHNPGCFWLKTWNENGALLRCEKTIMDLIVLTGREEVAGRGVACESSLHLLTPYMSDEHAILF